MKKRIIFALGLVWLATLVVGGFVFEAYAEEGRPFTATSNLNVRSDPGYGAVVATVPAGSEGLIYGEPQTSYFIKWEYVVFDAGPQGWVATQHGKYARSYSKPFPSQCYAGTFPAPGSKGCFANADGHSYHCGGVTYQKPQTSPCSIDVPDTVYYNEPFTIRVTGGTGQSIGIGEWRGPLSPAMCPSTLTNCTGATCTMEATATSPGTLFVGFFTHRPAPGGINVYGPTCRKTIHAVVRTGTPPPPPPVTPPPPVDITSQCAINGQTTSTLTKGVGERFTLPWTSSGAQGLRSSGWSGPVQCSHSDQTRSCKDVYLGAGLVGPNASWGNIFLESAGSASVTLTPIASNGSEGSSCSITVRTSGVDTPPPPPPSTTPPPPPPPAAPEQGLNYSPQRFGSPQAGQMRYSSTVGGNVYTGTDFPVGPEPRLVKAVGSGWLSCSPGQFMARYGLLVTASGGNSTVFKLNGRDEEDGLFVWWRQADGSYDWRRMTLAEYRAEDRTYDLPGQGNVPYAPNCVVNLTYGLTPPPPSVTPPPLPPPAPAGCFETDTDYLGSDINAGIYRPVASPGACQERCAARSDCYYFTYLPPTTSVGEGWCYLKSSNTGRQVRVGAISGPKICSAGSQPPPPPTPFPTEVKFEDGEPVRIKPHPTLGDISVYYRNDPLPDGKCGTVIGEKDVGDTGTIVGTMRTCGTGRYWKIRFDGGQGEGWVIQNRVGKVRVLPPPPLPPPAGTPPPPTEPPPPPPAGTLPPPPAAELKFEVDARVRIKPHPTLGDISVYYRNDPLPDGKCGTVIDEKWVGDAGTITASMKTCGAGRYWKVRFNDGEEGWVIQNRLQPILPSVSANSSDPNLANTLQGLRQSIENLQNALNNH